MIALARAHVSGELSLDSGIHRNPRETIERLAKLPGIGPWTAHYIAMRASGEPDSFPLDYRSLRRGLDWRPWRAYAAMHLWMDHLMTMGALT